MLEELILKYTQVTGVEDDLLTDTEIAGLEALAELWEIDPSLARPIETMLLGS